MPSTLIKTPTKKPDQRAVDLDWMILNVILPYQKKKKEKPAWDTTTSITSASGR